MKTLVFDAGALIAIERGSVPVRGYVLLADRGHVTLATSAAVVAQVWRGGTRQARLARLLASDLVAELALDSEASRRIGMLAATAPGARDVVDGHIAVIALDRDAIVLTSDPEDIARWGVPATHIVAC
ncbi:MAG TPA: PIN domain-containing protein [Polyangia bacterium]|nr:PIN domain-containing protein [Polyangia bacterium]